MTVTREDAVTARPCMGHCCHARSAGGYTTSSPERVEAERCASRSHRRSGSHQQSIGPAHDCQGASRSITHQPRMLDVCPCPSVRLGKTSVSPQHGTAAVKRLLEVMSALMWVTELSTRSTVHVPATCTSALGYTHGSIGRPACNCHATIRHACGSSAR